MRNQGFFWNKKATVTFRTQNVYLYWGGSSWKLKKKYVFWTSGNCKHQKDTKSSPKGTAAKKSILFNSKDQNEGGKKSWTGLTVL